MKTNYRTLADHRFLAHRSCSCWQTHCSVQCSIKFLIPQFLVFFSDLLQCTNEPNVSIPQLADLLIERTQNQSWVIVFKALITIHNLMNYGNEVSNFELRRRDRSYNYELIQVHKLLMVNTDHGVCKYVKIYGIVICSCMNVLVEPSTNYKYNVVVFWNTNKYLLVILTKILFS